ncbi:MAG TPA: restriction endonuclease [Candidatus Eisenbacteria bacterium]|nr:restriction endonuclease [Candidatus Eisenbacteria bacterium]
MSPSRSRKSIVELYAEPFADLPPVAGVIAAGVLGVAGWVAPLFGEGSTMTVIWLQFARWIFWLFAFAVLVSTGAGVLRRALDHRKFDSTEDASSLTWSQFERYIGEFYRRRGFTVTPRGGATSDGGVDLNLVSASGDRLIVQCKHWKNRHVGVRPLRELWGVLSDEKADGAVFITSDTFTPDAIAFAAGKRLELIDGPTLRTMIAAVKGSVAVKGSAAVKGSDAVEATPMPAAASQAPQCPHCGSPMVLRTATRGPKAGDKFWGCSTYPSCRGTRPVSDSPM